MDWDRKLIKILLSCGYDSTIANPEYYSSSTAAPIKALSQRGLVDELQAIKKAAQQVGLDYLNLAAQELQGKIQTAGFESNISSDFCWTHKIVPLYVENHAVTVACANPLDLDAIKQIQFALGQPVKVVIAEEDKIHHLINHSFTKALSTPQAEQVEVGQESIEFLNSAMEEEHDVHRTDADTAPVTKIINRVLHDAVRLAASDIHFDPTPGGLDIRYRIDGVMQHALDCAKRIQRPLVCKLKLLAAMNITEHRIAQDGRFRVRVDDQPIDLRASCIPTAYGEKIVLRILHTDFDSLSLERLGIPKETGTIFERDLSSPGRLILVTGPTGSGKTTTLYSCLKLLRDGTSNIETVEDPIEYKISGINQMQVNEIAGLNFATALRSMLRQDPDVIMVGEIRDHETAEIALQAAQTGHLVLSTLHTNDAPSAITRMQSLECDQFLLSSSLAGIMAQRLVRRICNDCSEQLKLQSDNLSEFCVERKLELSHLKQGRGCERCRFTGFKGRVGIYSYLHVTPQISEMIFNKASLKDIAEQAEHSGYVPLDKAALQLVQQGITSIHEVIDFFDLTKIGQVSVAPATTQTVLLVEDDEVNRQTVAANLRARLYEVFEACDGAEAIAYLENAKPNIVVTGLGLPKIDGRQLLQFIKNKEATKKIPVLILTSADSDENEAELLRLGATDFVSRTRSPEVVLERLKRLTGDTSL